MLYTESVLLILLVIKDHLRLLVAVLVAPEDCVVAGDPLVVHVAVGGEVGADHHHGHAVHAPPHAHTTLVSLKYIN